MLKVAKFGGSSTASAEQYRKIRAILEADPARQLVVVSAAGKRFDGDNKVTDLLYLCYAHLQYGVNYDSVLDRIRRRYEDIAAALGLKTDLAAQFTELRAQMDSGISQDALASRGEYLSALLMADYLGWEFLDAADFMRFRADGTVDLSQTTLLLREKAEGKRCVIPGFYGLLPSGRIKTFSRGGSDVTGAIVAAALDADVYENWTDVPGILMADPRIVPDPKPLDCVTYAELRELSGIGTQVLHEDTIAPVREKNIPINIRDTNAPSLPGTMICSELPAASPVRKLTGIFGRRHCILVSIRKTGLGTKPGDFTALLQVLDGYELPVLYYVGGIDRLTLLLSQKAEPQSLELLSQTLRRSGQAESVQITENISALATVSRSLAQDPAIAGRVLCTLCADGIPVSLALQAQPGLSFLAAVPDDRFEEAIRSLYTEFIQD